MRYEARFTATLEDVLTGYRMANRRGEDFLKLCAFGGITALFVFGIAACLLHFLALAVVGIFVGGGVVGAPLLMEWNVRRLARKSKPEEVLFYFTEDGFEFSNGITQSKNQWDNVAKASLDKRGMLLYIGSEGDCVFIPARAFVGGHYPLRELKSLLSSKKVKMA